MSDWCSAPQQLDSAELALYEKHSRDCEVVRKLYAHEHRITMRLHAAESAIERQQPEQDRQQLAEQRHTLRLALGEMSITGLAEGEQI